MSITVEKICRLCMSRSNIIHTLLQDNLLQKVAICVSLLINPDDKVLPLDICALCTLKVKDFFEFRQSCLKVQQLFEQSRTSAQEETSVPVKAIVPKVENSIPSTQAECIEISRLEVEFNHPVEEQQDYEQLDEDEIATELEQLEDDVEDQPEEIFDEQEETILDIDESVYSDNDCQDSDCRNDFKVEILELHEEEIAPQSAPNISKCTRESPVPLLYSRSGKEKVDVGTKFNRDSIKQKRNTKLNTKRDEKEIYRSLLKKCETCGKFVERNRLEGHVNRHANVRPYECSVPNCGIKFHCKIALRLHSQGRHSDKRLPCDICGKVYSSTKTLYHHKKETHSEKSFKCDLCTLCFVSNSRLNRHMMTHSDTFEFKCPHCPKEFYRSNNLKVHLRSHTKEKPYACSACDKAFGYQRLLRDHIARHHT
ncbi:zinc finger protein 62 homolog [Sabethes cyaneus]|uniref:zinc finger protein 62 homolog n=1 Tax=Sabethes cyaneus TaxID=53552 RepID=UPI00237DF349|nr:zinc finger protein 62 homolog [Sabethes cyaneus]